MPNQSGVFLFHCILDAINYKTHYFMFYLKNAVKVRYMAIAPSIVGCILSFKDIKM